VAVAIVARLGRTTTTPINSLLPNTQCNTSTTDRSSLYIQQRPCTRLRPCMLRRQCQAERVTVEHHRVTTNRQPTITKRSTKTPFQLSLPPLVSVDYHTTTWKCRVLKPPSSKVCSHHITTPIPITTTGNHNSLPLTPQLTTTTPIASSHLDRFTANKTQLLPCQQALIASRA